MLKRFIYGVVRYASMLVFFHAALPTTAEPTPSVGTERKNGHIMVPYRPVLLTVLCSVAVNAFVAPCGR